MVPIQSFGADSEKTLKQIQQNLNTTNSKKNRSIIQVKNLQKEILKLQNLTKDIAKKSQEYEYHLSKIENNIDDIDTEYDKILNRLENSTRDLSGIIATLQRVSNNPENAIVLYPGSSKQAIQSMSILRTILPQINIKKKSIEDDLNYIKTLKLDLAVEKKKFKLKSEQLKDNRNKLNYQINKKKTLRKKSQSKTKSLELKAKKLASKIRSIKDFLQKIEDDKKREKNSRRTKKPASIKRFPIKGKIPSPVTGRIIKRFGSKSISGKINTKIIIATRPMSSVIAPFDGYVAYAGKFKQLGRVIIISHEGGYNSVLVGVDKIYVKTGDWILTGEPIGIMPKTKPRLHIEIRYGTKPLNPLKWLDKKYIKG